GYGGVRRRVRRPEPGPVCAGAGGGGMTGPLAGTRGVSLGGIGPGPYAGMLLADLGCDVVRLDRAGVGWPAAMRVMGPGQRSLMIDLKPPRALAVVRPLVTGADGLIEGF